VVPLTGDFAPYRQALDDAFDMVESFRPDLLLYQAGADPHRNDPLGSLGMTTEQLLERDRVVFEFCRRKGLPVLFVLAGGYQEPIAEKLLPLHLNTFRAATFS
jgi:acetoin utilization deacetylase AcuC-like enzyme